MKRMELVSINNNPTAWFSLNHEDFKVASLNCRSLRKHMVDIRTDPMIRRADVICLTETWINASDSGDGLEMDGYKLHLNSVGHGKGLAIFHHENYVSEIIVKAEKFQISKLTHYQFDVFAVYRSNEGCQNTIIEAVRCSTIKSKPTIVVGDFNLCASEDRNCAMSHGMKELGFSQFVKRSTHIKGKISNHVCFT